LPGTGAANREAMQDTITMIHDAIIGTRDCINVSRQTLGDR
jgi:hypothetical protein